MQNRNSAFIMTTVLFALSQMADARSIAWDLGGTDSDWNTTDNWAQDLLPGSERIDIAVFAGSNDQGAINTTVRSRFPVDLTMRNGASLVIRADAGNMRNLRLASTPSSGTTMVVHTAGAVTSSGFLGLGEKGSALYRISGMAALNLAEKVIVFDSGIFSLSGSGASVTVGERGFSLRGAGELMFTFDAAGIGRITTAGSFSVDRTNSRLTVDTSAFDGIGSFALVNYESLEGRGFANGNVSIAGLGAERTGSITYDRQRMNLDIKLKPGAKGHYVDIPEPGSYPLFAGLIMMAYVMLCGRRR